MVAGACSSSGAFKMSKTCCISLLVRSGQPYFRPYPVALLKARQQASMYWHRACSAPCRSPRPTVPHRSTLPLPEVCGFSPPLFLHLQQGLELGGVYGRLGASNGDAPSLSTEEALSVSPSVTSSLVGADLPPSGASYLQPGKPFPDFSADI